MIEIISTLLKGVFYMLTETDLDLMRGVIAAPFIIAFVYALARAASFGWHKSKREHFYRILKATKEEENGNEEV